VQLLTIEKAAMRTIIWSFVFYLGLTTSVYSQTGTLIDSFPAPTTYMADIAWDGGYLLVLGLKNHILYRINPETGEVVDSLPIRIHSGLGLAGKNGKIWVGSYSGHAVKQIDARGKVVKSIPIPVSNPMGLAWDGTAFWVADSKPRERIVKVDSLGNLLSYFYFPGSNPFGLTADSLTVWCANNIYCCGATIYRFKKSTGEQLESFECPNNGKVVNGLAWDGKFLWIADQSNKMIYRVKVEPGVTGK